MADYTILTEVKRGQEIYWVQHGNVSDPNKGTPNSTIYKWVVDFIYIGAEYEVHNVTEMKDLLADPVEYVRVDLTNSWRGLFAIPFATEEDAKNYIISKISVKEIAAAAFTDLVKEDVKSKKKEKTKKESKEVKSK